MHMSTGSFNYLKLAVMVVGIILSVGIGLLLKDVTSYYIMIIIVGSMLSALSPTLVLNAKIKSTRTQSGHSFPIRSTC